MTLDDRKEAAERSEQQAANEILDSMENLDERVISTNALHCRRKIARTITEKRAR